MNPQINATYSSKRTYHNYFKNRDEAGNILADMLQKYRYDDTIVLALSEGSVTIASVIARRLHSLIAILLTKDIFLPDGRTVVGVIDEVGGFIYNNAFSAGEIEEFESEYRSNIESAKIAALHEMHIALGQGGIISNSYFKNRVVIVVADGSINGMAFEVAADFLHAIDTVRTVMVCAVASVSAVDRMHVLANEIACLNVTEAGFDTNHYFEDNTIPTKNEIIQTLNDIILQWQRSEHYEYEDKNKITQ